MRSKLVSAVVASALVMAVPSVAAAQEDTHQGGDRATVIGITFALTAMLVLILVNNKSNNLPVSP